MQHLDEGTIHAWLDGALDAEESARVEEHVASCATCAAAVAEARGLVAGSSRILSALDNAPANVVPRTLEGVPRRERSSLWRALRFTPARAAAAAVLIVAAGTVFVVREGDQRTAKEVLLSPMALDSAASSGGPSAVSASPVSQAPTAPAAPPSATPSARPSRAPSPENEAARVARQGAERVRDARAGDAPARSDSGISRASIGAATGRAAQGLASKAQMAVQDSAVRRSAEPVMQKTIAADSARQNAAMRLEQVVTTSAAEDRARAAAPGARAPVPAPVPAAAQRFEERRALAAESDVRGCYTVTADSAAGLPERLTLDTTTAALLTGEMLQRSARPQAAPAASGAGAAGNPAARRVLVGEGSVAGVWTEPSLGVVRILLVGPRTRVLELRRDASGALRGSVSGSTVVLRRGCT